MSEPAVISPEKLEQLPVSSLKPHDRNPRTHSKMQIRQIADSVRRFGFTNPVLVDASNSIIAGHGRVGAAKSMGLQTVPALRLEHMTEAERRAYVIADNRLAELAGWDNDLFAVEFEEVLRLDAEFELAAAGFGPAEIEALFNRHDDSKAAEEQVEVDEAAPVVRGRGDLWVLGRHRIICGDSMDPAIYERLMDGEKAQMVFMDPP